MRSYLESEKYPRVGEKVEVVHLNPSVTNGLLQAILDYFGGPELNKEQMSSRSLDNSGVVVEPVEKTNLTLWRIRHDDGTIAVYDISEIGKQNSAE